MLCNTLLGGSMNYPILQNLWRDDSGQDLMEYALVAALLALGSVATMNLLASTIGNALNEVSSALSSSLGLRH